MKIRAELNTDAVEAKAIFLYVCENPGGARWTKLPDETKARYRELARTSFASMNWQPMATAPKDGTIIEIQCTHGVAPWYGLYLWKESRGEHRWCKYGDDNSGIIVDEPGFELSFAWRKNTQEPDEYIDPTMGAQDTQGYWLRVCGLPSTAKHDNTRLSDMGAGLAAKTQSKPIVIERKPLSIKGFIKFWLTSMFVKPLAAIAFGLGLGTALALSHGHTPAWQAFAIVPLLLAILAPIVFVEYRKYVRGQERDRLLRTDARK